MTERGKYIVVEGADGTGKSTQVEMFAQWLQEEKGIECFIAHEPAGTPTADALRDIIKNKELERTPYTDVLMFTAARVEIWQQAKQVLKLGGYVLSARNYLSTEAYQGYGDGVSLELIRDTTRTFVGDEYMHPDYTLILALKDESERARRIAQRGPLEIADTFESRGADFQDRVNNAYLRIAEDYGFEVIDASASKEEIQHQIRRSLKLAA